MSERITLTVEDDGDTVFVYDRRAEWHMESPEEREATVTENELLRRLTTAERERDEAREQLRLANIDWANCAAAAADHRAEADALRHRAEFAERVVEAAREWLADLWRGDLNGTAIGVCMEYEPDGQYALWEQVAPIAEAVRALDAEAQP